MRCIDLGVRMISAGIKCSDLKGSKQAYCEELMSECISEAKASEGSPFDVKTCYSKTPIRLGVEGNCKIVIPVLVKERTECKEGDDSLAESACKDLSAEANSFCRNLMTGCMDAANDSSGEFEYKTCYSEKAFRLPNFNACKLVMPELVNLNGICGAKLVEQREQETREPPLVPLTPQKDTKTEEARNAKIAADKSKAEADKIAKVAADKSKAEADKRAKVTADKSKAEADKRAKIAADKVKAEADKRAKLAADKVKAEADKRAKVAADKAKAEAAAKVWHPKESSDDESDIEFKSGVVLLSRTQLKEQWKKSMYIVVSRDLETDEFRKFINTDISRPKIHDSKSDRVTGWGNIGIIDWNSMNGRRLAHSLGIPALAPGEKNSEWEVKGEIVGDKFVGEVDSAIPPDHLMRSDLMRVHSETPDSNGFLYMGPRDFDKHFGEGQDPSIDGYVVVYGKDLTGVHAAQLAESLADEGRYLRKNTRYLWAPSKNIGKLLKKKLGIKKSGVWRVTRSGDGWKSIRHRNSGFYSLSTGDDANNLVIKRNESVLVVVGATLSHGRTETRKLMKALRWERAAGKLNIAGKRVDRLVFVPRSNVENVFAGGIVDDIKADKGLPQVYMFHGKKSSRRLNQVSLSDLPGDVTPYKPKPKRVEKKAQSTNPFGSSGMLRLKLTPRKERKVEISDGRKHLHPTDASDNTSYNIFVNLRSNSIILLYGNATSDGSGGYKDKDLQSMADDLGAALFMGQTDGINVKFIDTSRGDLGYRKKLLKLGNGSSIPSKAGVYACERSGPKTPYTCSPYTIPED